MPWQKIYDLTPPPAGVRNLWTKAIVQNNLYMFHQTNPFILTVDTTTPGSVTVIENVDTDAFVNMDAIEGVFEARSRLGLWDSTNSIYWGDTADVLNFTPDLRTRANIVKVDSQKGNIIIVLGATEGFIIYSTANISGAKYSGTLQKVFNFFEISDNLGVFSDYSVTKGNDGTHFAWTNGGLYQVNNERNAMKPVATEVGDYLTSFQQSPRLSMHLNRYLAIWLHDEGIEFARTIRQKNFVDAATYWRQQFAYEPENPRFGDIFLEALAPNKGFDFNDGLPLECYPEVPLCPADQQDTVLWGMAVQDFPNFELQEVEIDSVEWDDDGASATSFIPLFRDFLTLPLAFTGAESYLRKQWTPTLESFQEIATNHAGYTIRPFIRYGFDPHELMMYQAYVWQAEDNDNFRHVTSDGVMAANQDYTVNDQWEHPISSRSGVVNVSDTTVVDDTITVDFRSGFYSSVLSQDETADEYVFTNTRVVFIETAVGNTRQTIIDQSTIRLDRAPTQTVESPSDFGARDGEVIAGPTPVVTVIPANGGNDGTIYLANAAVGIWEDDVYLAQQYTSIFGVIDQDTLLPDPNDSIARAFQEAATLGDRAYLVGIDFRKWSTASTIVATTDRCTYGDLQNYSKNRATTDTTVTRTFTTRLQYLGDDAFGDSRYIHIREQVVNVDYDVESLTSDLLGAPGPDIPKKYQLNPIPIATISHPSGANPAGVLKVFNAYAETRGVDIRQIYVDFGWTVTNPPSAAPFVPPDLQIASPPVGNIYNGTDPSGTFLEYFNLGTQCGRVGPRPVDPNHLGTLGNNFDDKFIPLSFPTLPDLTGPETVFLTQTGAPGQFFPTWDRVLIWDRLLERWGTCDVPLALFIDFSPVNEVTFDPVLEEFVTRFTYDNFLSRLGAVLENGVTVLWDDAPEDSYIVYGKIGWRRSRMTMMQEILLEFAENPNANIIVESSLDRRTLEPYNMRSEPVVRAGHTWYGTITARWFNIVVRGNRYHLTGLEFMGSPLGRE